MSDDTKIIITLENHPMNLSINITRQVDGVKVEDVSSVDMVPEFLPLFNICDGTSLATLRVRAEACGLAPHGDKTAIVHRAHAAVHGARGLLATLDGWNVNGDAPSVEAGKRGRPAGSTNKPAPKVFVIFDGTGPVTASETQFAVYCDAITAGKSPKSAAKLAMSAANTEE